MFSTEYEALTPPEGTASAHAVEALSGMLTDACPQWIDVVRNYVKDFVPKSSLHRKTENFTRADRACGITHLTSNPVTLYQLVLQSRAALGEVTVDDMKAALDKLDPNPYITKLPTWPAPDQLTGREHLARRSDVLLTSLAEKTLGTLHEHDVEHRDEPGQQLGSELVSLVMSSAALVTTARDISAVLNPSGPGQPPLELQETLRAQSVLIDSIMADLSANIVLEAIVYQDLRSRDDRMVEAGERDIENALATDLATDGALAAFGNALALIGELDGSTTVVQARPEAPRTEPRTSEPADSPLPTVGEIRAILTSGHTLKSVQLVSRALAESSLTTQADAPGQAVTLLDDMGEARKSMDLLRTLIETAPRVGSVDELRMVAYAMQEAPAVRLVDAEMRRFDYDFPVDTDGFARMAMLEMDKKRIPTVGAAGREALLGFSVLLTHIDAPASQEELLMRAILDLERRAILDLARRSMTSEIEGPADHNANNATTWFGVLDVMSRMPAAAWTEAGMNKHLVLWRQRQQEQAARSISVVPPAAPAATDSKDTRSRLRRF